MTLGEIRSMRKREVCQNMDGIIRAGERGLLKR
jgi:hypothetical protein